MHKPETRSIKSHYSGLDIFLLHVWVQNEMGFTEEEVHTERLNEELSVWSVMNSITVETNEIDRSCGQKQQHSV